MLLLEIHYYEARRLKQRIERDILLQKFRVEQ